MYDLDTLKHRLAEEKRARKQADSQLVEHANELAKARKGLADMAGIVAGIPYPVIMFSKNGTVSFANPASIRYWGSGVVPGASLYDVLSFTQDLEINELIENDGVLQLLARKKGDYFRFVFKGDAKQDVCHLYCLDVTEYEKAKFELQKAYRESEEILTTLPSVLIGVDKMGRVMLWNKKTESLFGIGEMEALGKSLGDIDIHWDKQRIDELVTATQENATFYEAKLKYVQQDGAERLLELVCTPVAQHHSRRAGVFLLVRDITDLSEEAVTSTNGEELAELVQLVTLLAQEMSVPIQVIGENMSYLDEAIRGMLELLEMNLTLLEHKEDGPELERHMQQLQDMVQSTQIDKMFLTLPNTVENTIEMIGKVTDLLQNAEKATAE